MCIRDSFHPVMEYLALVIEEDGGDVSFAGFLFLLFDHGVEAADGVPLQPLHGAAAVQDENKFRQILFHNKSPYAVLFGLQVQYRGICIFSGRLAGDKFQQGYKVLPSSLPQSDTQLPIWTYGPGEQIGNNSDL